MVPFTDAGAATFADMLKSSSPNNLLKMQNLARYMQEHDAARAEQILSMTNQELIGRGLCTVCAKAHETSACPVLTEMAERMNDEDDAEGGVLV